MQIWKKKEWWWWVKIFTLYQQNRIFIVTKYHSPFSAAQIWGWGRQNRHVNKNIMSIYSKTKTPFPGRAASCWYLTLYPEANYAMYHILCAFEAAGCTLPSLNTDFRTGQCRYFFQVGMNLSIEQRQSMPHALVERCNAQKSLCSCRSPLHTVMYLNLWSMQK